MPNIKYIYLISRNNICVNPDLLGSGIVRIQIQIRIRIRQTKTQTQARPDPDPDPGSKIQIQIQNPEKKFVWKNCKFEPPKVREIANLSLTFHRQDFV